jgi:hypothetical protein
VYCIKLGPMGSVGIGGQCSKNSILTVNFTECLPDIFSSQSSFDLQVNAG